MKILLFVPLLCFPFLSQQNPADDGSAITVVHSKWSRARRLVEKSDQAEGITPPASAMIPANKNFARNVRMNEPMGVRDPNADTLDGRSAQIEKNVQEARSPQAKPVDGYLYKIKVQNSSTKVVEVLFWEYQFLDPKDSTNLSRHQFFCGVDIRQGKEKELEGFSVASPSNVVNVEVLAKKESPFQEKIVINRVEYADGTIWQRNDWSLKDVRARYERALIGPWLPAMCKRL